jgi:amino acid adenylation domain-containing protein/FkbM family methyltransferase
MTAQQTIPELIALWARQTPDAVAVECQGRTLTYRELDLCGGGVAAVLAAQGIALGSVVAVNADRTLETVTAILGILQAGCVYVPLDPHAPAHHLRTVLDHTRPAMLLAAAGTAPDVQLPRRTISLNETAPPLPSADYTGLAYLMPTSGTGGTVKIAQITHQNVCYNVRALGETLGGITPADVYLHFASFAFSSSVRQLFLPLSNGARVVLTTAAERADPRRTIDRVRASRVSVIDVIPSVLAVLMDVLESTPPAGGAPLLSDDVRLLLTASERLPGALVGRWLRVSKPGTRMFNMYGQTETAGIVAAQPVTAAHTACTTVPIGWSLPGSTIEVLSSDGGPAGVGEVGEIVVAGPGIGRGYLSDRGLAPAAFVPGGDDGRYRTRDLGLLNPANVLEYVGRADSQVKIRGHRVDLAQLERILEEHPAVAESVVADVSADGGEVQLAAVVRLQRGYVDAEVAERLRDLPGGLRILDMNPPETDFMYDEIFRRNVYLRHGLTLAADACVIDAGANIGLFSLFVAAGYPDARVYAVEPAAPTAAVLQVNVAVNGCENVTVHEVALSDHVGASTITFYPHSVGMSSVHPDSSQEAATLTSIIGNQFRQDLIDGAPELHSFTGDLVNAKLVEQKLRCSLIRLSDLIAAEGIDRVDLLKIDVQKSELELLNGVDEHDWPKIRQIAAEVHDIDGRLHLMVSELQKRGYTVATEQDVMFTGSGMYYLYARRDDPAPINERGTGPARTSPRQATRNVSGAELRAFLRERVASHQMPASLRILTDLPRTASGKVDRADLIRRHQAAPQTTPAAEQGNDRYIAAVSAIWSEVLGKPVRADDDFFDIGGNSLAAARVITRLRERYAPDIPIRWIFEAPRLDAFAGLLRAHPGAGNARDQSGESA